MLLTLMDVDQLLDNTVTLDSSTPAARLRGGRDDLVHVAVLLSYARHVLSVDIGALRAIAEASTGDLQDLVDGLPRCRGSLDRRGMVVVPRRAGHHRIGPPGDGGRGRRADAGARRTGPPRPSLARGGAGHPPRARGPGVPVSECRELVEKRVREVQALLVEQYKRGDADPDDWVR